jgi:hypothetical protein
VLAPIFQLFLGICKAQGPVRVQAFGPEVAMSASMNSFSGIVYPVSPIDRSAE